MKVTVGRTEEAAVKIALIKEQLGKNEAVRLRGLDWFAWATAGGSSALSLTAEAGLAEVLVTATDVWIVTDEIEGKRLREEEVPAGLTIHTFPWAHPGRRESFVKEAAGAAAWIASDRPMPGEFPLPARLVRAKRTMTNPEAERYVKIGGLAAEAMTETLLSAEPGWSEWQLAAAGSQALVSRGLQPVLVLAAGERRLQLYRQPPPSREPLGKSAMLAVSARGDGLHANLTRFVSFGKLAPSAAELHEKVRDIEAAALAQSRPGVCLNDIYQTLQDKYAAVGQEAAIRQHHLGGITGYLPRELLAMPGTPDPLKENMAVAWNPSLTGARIEDTFLLTETGLLNLTRDTAWPTTQVAGIERPLVMER